MSAKPIEKKWIGLTVETWPMDEVSTRNCFNCLVDNIGRYVLCRVGHPMTPSKRPTEKLTCRAVLVRAYLFHSCHGCTGLDTKWA